MREQFIRWKDGIPIELMRIDVLGRLYAFKRQKKDEMVFSVVPKGGYRGSANMLKALLAKRRWSQEDAEETLGVSQSAISKYITGKRTMPLWLALHIESWNTEVAFDGSWQKKYKAEKIIKLRRGTHIALMRIEAFGKVYGYDYHKEGEMVFKAVPKRECQEGKLLKEYRKKYHLTQAQAGKALRVSQSMIAKYESGKRVLDGPKLRTVQIMTRLSVEEAKQWLAYYRKRAGLDASDKH